VAVHGSKYTRGGEVGGRASRLDRFVLEVDGWNIVVTQGVNWLLGPPMVRKPCNKSPEGPLGV